MQVLIFAPLFTLTVDILELPIGIFENWISRKYSLSVQGWPSWAWDWTKGEFISVILATILTFILYAVIRSSPRRWWFYFWLISLPLLIFLIFLQPLVIDPMFHKFEPLTQKDAPLVTSLEQMVQRAGENIPPERMFWMGAAEKSNELNAYVTGLGSSKRIVVWDTTIAKLNTPQIVFVAGHETGHYALQHIPKELTISVVGFVRSLLSRLSLDGLAAGAPRRPVGYSRHGRLGFASCFASAAGTVFVRRHSPLQRHQPALRASGGSVRP